MNSSKCIYSHNVYSDYITRTVQIYCSTWVRFFKNTLLLKGLSCTWWYFWRDWATFFSNRINFIFYRKNEGLVTRWEYDPIRTIAVNLTFFIHFYHFSFFIFIKCYFWVFRVVVTLPDAFESDLGNFKLFKVFKAISLDSTNI